MLLRSLQSFVHVAALIGLLWAATALALPSTAIIRRAADWNGITPRDGQPNCHIFDPDPRDTWDYQAYTSTRKVGKDIDCSSSSIPCHTNDTDVPDDLKITWTIQWRTIARDVGIDIQEFDASEVVGAGYANEVTEYPGNFGGGFSVSPGQQGYIAATPQAIGVPGWFRDCGNGWDYGGSALVPAKHIEYHLVYHN